MHYPINAYTRSCYSCVIYHYCIFLFAVGKRKKKLSVFFLFNCTFLYHFRPLLWRSTEIYKIIIRQFNINKSLQKKGCSLKNVIINQLIPQTTKQQIRPMCWTEEPHVSDPFCLKYWHAPHCATGRRYKKMVGGPKLSLSSPFVIKASYFSSLWDRWAGVQPPMSGCPV